MCWTELTASRTHVCVYDCALLMQEETETLVVATDTSRHERDARTVNSYDIRSGRLVSQLCVSPATLSSAKTPLEQVHLRASSESAASAPEIWALGRHELFASTSGWDAESERV